MTEESDMTDDTMTVEQEWMYYGYVVGEKLVEMLDWLKQRRAKNEEQVAAYEASLRALLAGTVTRDGCTAGDAVGYASELDTKISDEVARYSEVLDEDITTTACHRFANCVMKEARSRGVKVRHTHDELRDYFDEHAV